MNGRSPPHRLLAVALPGLVALLAGCGPEAEPPVDPRLTVVAQPVSGVLAITVDGWIDNRSPVAFSPALAWMPLQRAVTEGTRVEIGDELVRHDTTMLRQWIADNTRELTQLTAEQERHRLDLARRLEELQLVMTDAQADRAVRTAKIGTDREDEQVQRRLARLELDLARTVLARATVKAAAAEELAVRGRTPRTDAAKAVSDRERAARRVAAAEEALATWDGSGPRALARQQLEVSLERARRELEGLASAGERLANARSQGEAEIALATGDLRRVEHELAERTAFAADPILRTTVAGTVRLKNPEVRAGAKLPVTPFLFVLADEETVAYVRIPEALRDLCTVWTPARPQDGQAEVAVPAVGLTLPARVLSIGATAESRKEGGRVFVAVLKLTADEAQFAKLKPGMRLQADLTAAATPRALLPAWSVRGREDTREPLAVLPDGGTRRLRGVRVGGDFIVTKGLTAGDAVIALGPPPTGVGEGRSTRQRLMGVLEPLADLPVRLSSLDWDVAEVVPDGSRVVRGQRIARLAKTSWWIEPEKVKWNRDAGRALAQAERQRARFTADGELLTATKTWRDADLDRAEARIRVLAEGAGDTQRLWADAEAARVEAEARAGEAETQAAAAADPRLRVALSRNAFEDQRLAALGSRRAADSAALSAAAAHWPDLLALLSRSADFLTALDKAEDARAAWHVARLQHAQALDRADQAQARRIDELARESSQLDDEEVFAPAAGRLFHRNPAPWRPGDGIWTFEPFRLVPDPPAGGTVRRRLKLEAPAHRAGSWTQGASVPVVVPGVGTFPGTVVVVATWYGTSSAGRTEADTGGSSTAVDEQVFNLEIDLPLSAADSERVLPGMTAYVE